MKPAFRNGVVIKTTEVDMKRISLAFVLFFLTALSAFARGTDFGLSFDVPDPRLLAPISAKVDLTGRDSLEFKWSPFEGQQWLRKYYDFRIYKGRNMVEANIIYRKHVDPATYSVVLGSDLFQEGQVYTWSLRQVYDSDKSAEVYNSFTVIKNDKAKSKPKTN